MTTQFAPPIQKPVDSLSYIFSDATPLEYLEVESGTRNDPSGTDLISPVSFIISIKYSRVDAVYNTNYIPVKTIKFVLPLDRNLIQNWQKLLLPNNSDDSSNLMALRATEYIKTMLRMSEIKIAKLVEVSRNTIRNWRNGQGVYPSTTRKLFQVKHLISALNSVMTQDQMSIWLNGADDDDPSLTRLDRLAQPDGPALVAQQASSLLFPPPPGNLPPPAALRRELERIELEEKGWAEYEDAPHQFSARPRRQRPAQGTER